MSKPGFQANVPRETSAIGLGFFRRDGLFKLPQHSQSQPLSH